MKVLFLVFIVAAVSQAGKIDWDNLRFGNGRIIGGDPATPHQFPYQVGLVISLENEGQAFCGGSLISPESVLTAAHCVDKIKSAEVILGAHKIQEEEPTQVRLTSTEFIIHPNWNSNLYTGDIAIIKLPQPVELNEYISLVKLPSRSDVSDTFLDDTAIISGWGPYSTSSTVISKYLKFTFTSVFSNFKCSFSYPLMIKSSHLCVHGIRGFPLTNGDDGGPLTILVDDTVKQIGIFSFGRSKGDTFVHTRITSYLDWIEKNAGVTITTK